MAENSAFLPNSFQTPNWYVDGFLDLLTPEEWKVLTYVIRRVFGFQKRRDRIALSQITSGISNAAGERLDGGTGLSEDAGRRALVSLCQYGLVLKVSENDPAVNEGPEYELQLDSAKVDRAGLLARREERATANAARTSKARASRAGAISAGAALGVALDAADDPVMSDRWGNVPHDPVLSDITTPVLSDIPTPVMSDMDTINRGNQVGNTERAAGADAPARSTHAIKRGDILDGILAYAAAAPSGPDLSEFPPDVQDVLAAFLKYWPVDVPKRPSNGKGAFGQWIGEARALVLATSEYGLALLDQVYQDWKASPFCVSHPAAVISITRSRVGQLRADARKSAVRSAPATLAADQMAALRQAQEAQRRGRAGYVGGEK